ncbi:MAG: diaminobutyrate--2-oxoglutarate transaminase [Proteobacteria bacterium]|nr:diaminobutyrate--2-oxoglutarate transaminase [Pseudomonadota bacterium]
MHLLNARPTASRDDRDSAESQPSSSAFTEYESRVRYYGRNFPSLFETARGSIMRDRSGREYIDFFAGAGALNYGHNDPGMKARLIAYIECNGITHSLDFETGAKEAFILDFQDTILRPRGLAYRMLFSGPTGTNAVEAALKVARKATGRTRIVAFEHSFHGMTAGSMAVSGGPLRQSSILPPIGGTIFLPYDDGSGADGLDRLECMLAEAPSESQLPAACIVETIQAEGGVIVASLPWLRRLSDICHHYGLLLIVDDIQTGCGRTGSFFSFEPAGLQPDIVCLSKSLSGMGLPLALVLIKDAYDCLAPGEHTGTFRGNDLAFVTAVSALRFWRDDTFEQEIAGKAERLRQRLQAIADRHPSVVNPVVRGRGMIQGLVMASGDLARRTSTEAFSRGLIIETASPKGDVLKSLCPLTISEDDLEAGLDILAGAVAAVAA